MTESARQMAPQMNRELREVLRFLNIICQHFTGPLTIFECSENTARCYYHFSKSFTREDKIMTVVNMAYNFPNNGRTVQRLDDGRGEQFRVQVPSSVVADTAEDPE